MWMYGVVALMAIFMLTFKPDRTLHSLATIDATNMLIWHHACVDYVCHNHHYQGLITRDQLLKLPAIYHPLRHWKSLSTNGAVVTYADHDSAALSPPRLADALSELTAFDVTVGLVQQGVLHSAGRGPALSIPTAIPHGVAAIITRINTQEAL